MRFFSRKSRNGNTQAIPITPSQPSSMNDNSDIPDAQESGIINNPSIPDDYENPSNTVSDNWVDPYQKARDDLTEVYNTSNESSMTAYSMKENLIQLFTNAHGEPRKVQSLLNHVDRLVELTDKISQDAITLNQVQLHSIKIHGISKDVSEANEHLQKIKDEIDKMENGVRSRYPSLIQDYQTIGQELATLNTDFESIQNHLSELTYGSDSVSLSQPEVFE